jgi:hypothetical protein
VPALYHGHLGPFFFVPYARDLARRVPATSNGTLLELACGTGIFTEELLADLRSAGFSEITFETVDLTGTAPSAGHVATGLVQGSPIAHVVRERATAPVDTVTRALADAIVRRFGAGEVRVPMRAHVFAARA